VVWSYVTKNECFASRVRVRADYVEDIQLNVSFEGLLKHPKLNPATEMQIEKLTISTVDGRRVLVNQFHELVAVSSRGRLGEGWGITRL
jgi:hypothetical protein